MKADSNVSAGIKEQSSPSPLGKVGMGLLILFFLLPAIGEACPLCQGSGTKDTDFAYKGITLFLALLPILGGGGIFYWIYLKNKNIEENK